MDKQKKQWLLQRAKELRQNQTPQESELWRFLRARRFEGLKFYRQYLIDSCIVDFCCPEKMLIIELDGGGHSEKQNQDSERDKDLGLRGYQIFRVWNSEWNKNSQGVLARLAELLNVPSPVSRG